MNIRKYTEVYSKELNKIKIDAKKRISLKEDVINPSIKEIEKIREMKALFILSLPETSKYFEDRFFDYRQEKIDKSFYGKLKSFFDEPCSDTYRSPPVNLYDYYPVYKVREMFLKVDQVIVGFEEFRAILLMEQNFERKLTQEEIAEDCRNIPN